MNTAAKFQFSVQNEQSTGTPKSQTFSNRCLEKGKKLYLKPKSADVHFLFGAKDTTATRVPAHKAILAADSDVFEAMFYGDLKEPGDVHVTDSTEAAFMEFLQYFYLTEVTLTAENVVGVLDLGTKYDVQKCVNDCVQFLMSTINTENVCAHLDVAILYDKQQLLKLCERRVLVDAVSVFNAVGFQKCSKRVLAHILKMTVLTCTEVDVFDACMAWVKAKSGRDTLSIELVEQYLGDLYYEIRLASLTIEKFCGLHTKYESVLARDYVTITKMIALPEYEAPKFNKCHRNAAWNANAIVECDRKPTNNSSSEAEEFAYAYDHDYTAVLKYEETTFSVSAPMMLGSLWGCQIFLEDGGWSYDLLHGSVEMIEAMDLDGANSKVLSTTKIHFQSNDGAYVLLSNPILIRPGFFYTIRIGPFPPSYSYYSKYLNRKVEVDSEITIEFHKNYDRSLVQLMNFNKV